MERFLLCKKKITQIFLDNNYSLEEKKIFINAKKKISEKINNLISLEVCKIIEAKLKEC